MRAAYVRAAYVRAAYVRAAHGRGSGWHRIAAETGRARISAGGLEKDVAVTLAGASVLDEVDRVCRKKYNSHYATIVRT